MKTSQYFSFCPTNWIYTIKFIQHFDGFLNNGIILLRLVVKLIKKKKKKILLSNIVFVIAVVHNGCTWDFRIFGEYYVQKCRNPPKIRSLACSLVRLLARQRVRFHLTMKNAFRPHRREEDRVNVGSYLKPRYYTHSNTNKETRENFTNTWNFLSAAKEETSRKAEHLYFLKMSFT